MNVNEAIAYIHSVFWKGSIPGLGRTQELLRRIGNPEKKLKFIHIAGTNGKGSTAAMTASILRQAGYRTGLYTSPYIYRFHERMQIDGEQISDEDLVQITEFVKPHADAMAESPTEFELVSCIAFEYFARKNCDIVVLEVGMGGALDSTNVIPTPEVAVITNIGLDHTDYLGDTVEKIAETKAGIFKEGGSAVVYPGSAGVEEVYKTVCAERNVSLKIADFGKLTLQSHDLFGQVFDFDQILSGGNIFALFAIGLGDGAVIRSLGGGVRQIFLCDNKISLRLFELGFDVDDICFGLFDIRLSVLVVDHGRFVFGLTGGAAVPELGETVKVKFGFFKIDF